MSRPVAKKHHYILEIQEATTGSSITITCASFRSQTIVAETVQFLPRIGASINYVHRSILFRLSILFYRYLKTDNGIVYAADF